MQRKIPHHDLVLEPRQFARAWWDVLAGDYLRASAVILLFLLFSGLSILSVIPDGVSVSAYQYEQFEKLTTCRKMRDARRKGDMEGSVFEHIFTPHSAMIVFKLISSTSPALSGQSSIFRRPLEAQ